MADPTTHRFYAYADAVGRGNGHMIDAESVEAAAVAYAEAWSPPVDAENDIRVFVQNPDDGIEHCFTLNLDQGGAPEPCD